jgi:hypothetical protein
MNHPQPIEPTVVLSVVDKLRARYRAERDIFQQTGCIKAMKAMVQAWDALRLELRTTSEVTL